VNSCTEHPAFWPTILIIEPDLFPDEMRALRPPWPIHARDESLRFILAPHMCQSSVFIDVKLVSDSKAIVMVLFSTHEALDDLSNNIVAL
jgi:hypothetical protein